MKKITVMMFAAALAATACKDNKTADSVSTGTEQSAAAHSGDAYTIDQSASTIKWHATHKGGLNPRYGTVSGTGTLTADNGNLVSGEYTADMNTLLTDPAAVNPNEGKRSTDLDEHLKSEDFFDVASHPNVVFTITKVEDLAAGTEARLEGANKLVSGNLSIKGQTVNVTFPAKVDVTENELRLASKFIINRKDWGLNYKTEGNPADWAISQDVELDLNILAKK